MATADNLDRARAAYRHGRWTESYRLASALVIRERTVERHRSNIFNKLDIASRAAATAYAYEHRLL